MLGGMKTLLLLVLSLVVLAACGGDEFSAGRDGLGAAGAPDSGTGGTVSAAGSGGAVDTGGTDDGGSTASGGSGASVAGTGGSTDAGASSGGGVGTGGSDTGGAGGAGGSTTGGAAGLPPVVYEERLTCGGAVPIGGVCAQTENLAPATCMAAGSCGCPLGGTLCRDTRMPEDHQLTCQQGPCAQPKAPLRVVCTGNWHCGNGTICGTQGGSQGVCFCTATNHTVCRSATGHITCAAPGTPCAY